jgi:hypothetical protein
MVGATGFEPVTTRTPSVCATRLRYAPTMVSSRGKSTITPELNQFHTHACEVDTPPSPRLASLRYMRLERLPTM